MLSRISRHTEHSLTSVSFRKDDLLSSAIADRFSLLNIPEGSTESRTFLCCVSVC